MNNDVEIRLKDSGYNVSTGSFGIPYKVPVSDRYQPVIINGSMPADLAEQEIIIINLLQSDILDESKGEKATSQGENDWWASCRYGRIDPRPRIMTWAKEDFDKILKHGGVFIIFADDKEIQKLMLGHMYIGDLVIQRDISHKCHNWCFLSDLNYLEVKSGKGREIVTKEDPLSIKDYIEDAVYLCTLNPITQSATERFMPLAENKFCEYVSCAILPNDDIKGYIFIFPQILDISSFIISFIDESLSVISPNLFPYSEKANWLRYPEYEITSVIELNKEINELQEKTKIEVVELEKKCIEERQKFGYLHELLSSSGNTLVIAVKTTLESLGFSSIIDADEELKESNGSVPKREDLRIYDGSPILLIEIKGISGLPKDDDALQVSKYMIPRMKEWGRTDIQGLFIINHQKNLPPLERENKSIFRDDILANASEQGFGLLTTWDLFRLARSYKKNNWKYDYIKELFYKKGRIDIIPSHYTYLGVIRDFAERANAVGVEIEANELKLGDRIAFELPIEFEEQEVDSIQAEKKPINLAKAGMLVGIKTHLTKKQAKKGMRVFKVG